MSRFTLASLFLMFSMVSVSFSQEPPKLLSHAAHCIVYWDDLAKTKSGRLSLGYVVDTKNFPGKKYIYVIAFSNPSRTSGFVYDLAVEKREHNEVLRVVNNGQFRETKRGIEFTNEPLGGIWTHEHIEMAIKETRRKPAFTFEVNDLMKSVPGLRCESYADIK